MCQGRQLIQCEAFVALIAVTNSLYELIVSRMQAPQVDVTRQHLRLPKQLRPHDVAVTAMEAMHIIHPEALFPGAPLNGWWQYFLHGTAQNQSGPSIT